MRLNRQRQDSGRFPLKVFLLATLFLALAWSEFTKDSLGYDPMAPTAIAHPSQPDPTAPLPPQTREQGGDAQEEFEYRDQEALRLAEEEDEEIEDPTLAVADDLDDALSRILVRQPNLPSLLAPIAALSYIHLLYLSSVSRGYLVETLQLLAFACFPTLPLIQLISNTHKTVVASFRARNTPGSPLLPRTYILAGLGGMYAFRRGEAFSSLTLRRRRVSEYPLGAVASMPAQPLKSIGYLLQLCVVLVQLAAAALAFALSYSAPRRSDWDLATLGVDQRAWWTALAGTIASMLCLLLHLSNRTWVVGGEAHPHMHGGSTAANEKWRAAGALSAQALPAAQALEGVDSSLLWEATVLSEIVCAALLQDAAVAWGGGSYSLVGFLSVFLANRVVLGLVFLLGLIFNRYIRRYAATRWQALGQESGAAGGQAAGEAAARRRRWEATLRPLFVVFSCAVCAGIIVLQITTALGERGVAWRDGQRGSPSSVGGLGRAA